MTPPASLRSTLSGGADPWRLVTDRLDRHEVALAELRVAHATSSSELRASIARTPKTIGAIVAIVGALAPYLPGIAGEIARAISSIF